MPRAPIDGSVVVTPHGAWGAARPGGRLHTGLDLRAPLGTKVYAPEDGQVWYSVAGNAIQPLSGFGPAAVVIVGNVTDTWHVLGHLDAGSLQYGNKHTSGVADMIGATIREGELVGTVGPFRNAAGKLAPHLHWTTADASDIQVPYRRAPRFNPEDWLDAWNVAQTPIAPSSPSSSPSSTSTPNRSGGSTWPMLLLLLLLGLRRGAR